MMVIQKTNTVSSQILWRECVKFVENKAKKLLQDSGLQKPPFLPEYFARIIGIKVIKEDLGNLDGILMPLNNGFQIKVNVRHAVERQSFSCAHEIMHTFFIPEEGRSLIEQLNQENKRKVKNSLEEDLCNIGAAELLMPSFIFRQHASHYDYRIDAIIPLANIFKTSIFATSVRLIEIIPRTSFLVKWDPIYSEESRNFQFCAERTISSTKIKFLFHKKYTNNHSIIEAYKSDIPTYAQEFMKLGGFSGLCSVESQGFGNKPYRYVISLIFPQFSSQ